MKNSAKDRGCNTQRIGAYRALVRPQLEYASFIWSPWQQGLSALIEKVQCHSARFVMNDHQYNPRVSNMILNLS